MLFLVKSLKVRYSGDRMEEYVILVDQDDNPIGKEDKVKCHLPNGKLHRAFTALIFNGDGKLLLTKRSESKMLWPNDWDGTVASHPKESETYVLSAERRMPEEIGIACKMNYVNKFEYHVPYKDIGFESEFRPFVYLANKMINSNQNVSGLEITIDSDIPIGVGLGSSSACCVAATASIFDCFSSRRL